MANPNARPAHACPSIRRSTAAPLNSPRLRNVASSTRKVHINQVGFLPGEPKRAVIPATGPIPGNAFAIVDDDVTPEVRFTGTLTPYHSPNGAKYGHYDHHFFADFGAFQRPGRYRVRLSDGHLSPPFSIGAHVYSQLVPLLLKYFDVQRAARRNRRIAATAMWTTASSSAGRATGIASTLPAAGTTRATT